METGVSTALQIIDEIEHIRSRNNKNWMDILRLAFMHAPTEAADILANIYLEDDKISKLAKQLTESGNDR